MDEERAFGCLVAFFWAFCLAAVLVVVGVVFGAGFLFARWWS